MDNQNNEPKYKMTIGLSVLEHLGIGLYSNVPAVLSEVVANAWDADAENVCITIDPGQREIIISDDGSGMTVSDINEKYLKVGYKKRESEPNQGITPKFGRPPMGRKGIGKLSLFSIAETIEIHTVKDGEKNAFRMSSKDIQSKIKRQTSEDYHPESLKSELVQNAQGTRIKLTDLKKKIFRASEFLRKRLARRFSIIGSNFNVSINGEPISPKDRDYYKHIQFLWYFGEESKNFKELCSNAERYGSIDEIVDQENGYRISGWIGTVEKQSQIDEDINSIVIFANGKLVHENMLKDMKEGGVWTKYIIGEINADFMDDSDEEDIITSARQSLKEDDQRYIQLKEFLQDGNGVIRQIAANWQKWRNESGGKKVLRKRKNIKRWYDQLKGDLLKKSAKKLLGKIEVLEVGEADKKELYKASMLAFERLKITEQLSILNSLETEKDFELISKTFGGLTELARVHYYDIAKVRVGVIEKFKEIIDEDKKERVIQEHIFKALWLLDPSWERAATNSRMEETVKKEFGKVKGLSDEEKKARIDIRYQTVTGKHVIIELKRYSASVSIYALLEQMDKYKEALQTCLKHSDDRYRNMPVEIICITGTRPRTEKAERLLIAERARWITYDELIDNALNSYQEYLNAEKRISELVSIIDSIDEDFDT